MDIKSLRLQDRKGSAGSGRGPRTPMNLFFLSLLALAWIFFLTDGAYAVGTTPFTDGRWKFYDNDNTDETAYNVISGTDMTITAGGAELWTSADQYAAYYLDDIDGDFEATVKIISESSAWGWQKAGLMVRDDITAAADHRSDGYLIVAATRDNGYIVQYDSDGNGMLDVSIQTGYVTYPCWLKLKKVYRTIYGYYSTNGTTWNLIAFRTFDSGGNVANRVQDVGLFESAVNIQSGLLLTTQFGDFTSTNLPIATSYTITTEAGENGAINPTGPVEVSLGDDQTFTVVPDEGYEVASVLVDGNPVSTHDNQYDFRNVDADHTISATFSIITYTIEATTGDDGSIYPSGDVSVSYNGSRTFTVTPDEGYEVETVTVDGEAAELTNDQYSFVNVTDDHSIHVTFVEAEPETEPTTIAGCSTNTSTDYSAGFEAADFELTNVDVSNGTLLLSTGDDAINPESIVIPFEQEVSVTFLYEGAAYVSDFGWMLKSDVVDESGNFLGWENIPLESRHPIFRNIFDDNEGDGCCNGGNGILDTDYGEGGFPTSDEGALASYGDGTGYPFVVDGDGSVTPKDMKKVLGTFSAGTELVFFLTADKDWDSSNGTGVFFTKKDWNPDVYGTCGSGTFNKIYHLDQASSEGGCVTDGGWLTGTAQSRLSDWFGVTLSGTYSLPITVGEQYSHVIVGAPPDDPNQWILGWEDISGGGDADHNDMVFRIERRTGGIAELKTSQAIEPEDVDAYFTAVTFEVYDRMPCAGDTGITYYVSIDNGENWVEITEWDVVMETDASKVLGDPVANWTPGSPEYTYRTRRIDFAGRGLSGRALLWKAEMVSEQVSCIPGILDVVIHGDVNTHGSFSRSSPVVLSNVLYSGAYETPSLSWTEKTLRGHLTATRLYDPSNPNSTATMGIWDAGTVLNNKSPGARAIYFPDIALSGVTNEVLGTGDSGTTTFSGTLGHYPVSATTLVITDQTENFVDKHTQVLEGSLGGTGTINRFTGAYALTFNSPPGDGVPIVAGYSYYIASSALLDFNTTNVNSEMLGLDDTYIIPPGFIYDFNGDGKFNNVDASGSGTPDDSDGDWLVNWIRGYKDGSSTKKEWLLGAIDHSVPALQTPPGKPAWYWGSDVTEAERESFNTFREDNQERRTIAYVGARDGMLHAFDAGDFRWGDNPDTVDILEQRGYFQWEGDPLNPNYGTGDELWAFIPANLIPRFKNNVLKGDDQSFVDASPALSDVFVNGSWKTVLLCAEGNGGDTVFCLDVTDPDNPSFMWEFADPDLFRSRSSPAIARIGRIVVEGTPKWVAFFVSGKSYDPTLYPSVYIIDISDGSVIQRYFFDAESNGVGGVPSGQPAIVDSDANGYIDRLYIGTDKGYMYKLNIPDCPGDVVSGFSHCVINSDFVDDNENTVNESQRYHPIYASPAIVVESSLTSSGDVDYRVKIFFGTGDNPYSDEDINTAETTYHFFAYVDEAEKGDCGSDSVYLDWFYTLPEGHRVFASAFAAAGTIYFGTSTAETDDPCEETNEGQIIGLSIEDGSTVFSQTVGNISVSPVVDDMHLYIKTPAGLMSFGGDQYNNALKIVGESDISTRMWRELF